MNLLRIFNFENHHFKLYKILITIITFLAKSVRSGAKGVFRIFTAIIDYITYAIFVKAFGFSIVVANTMSWIIAESFAFGTNKIFTYRGKGKKLVRMEYIRFLFARIFILAVETIILKVSVDMLNFEELKMKLFAMCVVIILNPILNRYFIFKKSKYISKLQLLNIKAKLKKIKHNKNLPE